MFKRDPNDVTKLLKSDAELQGQGLLDPFRRQDIFRVPNTHEYSDTPEGSGPPYPEQRSPRRKPPEPKR